MYDHNYSSTEDHSLAYFIYSKSGIVGFPIYFVAQVMNNCCNFFYSISPSLTEFVIHLTCTSFFVLIFGLSAYFLVSYCSILYILSLRLFVGIGVFIFIAHHIYQKLNMAFINWRRYDKI
jgi:hypothetical protein